MTDYQRLFTTDDVRILQRQTSHRRFLRVDTLRLQHRLYAGGWSEPMSREVLVKPPAVGVLLYDPDRNELVMVRQFRVGMLDREDAPWPLELVAGVADQEGETPEQVAIRETREETGLEATDCIRICDYYNSPGTSSERVTLFCARVDAAAADGVHGLPHEHEDILVAVLGEEQARRAMESGAITNAMSLIALQWLVAHKREVLARWA